MAEYRVTWRPVVGFEGIYEVRPGSDGGAVRRVQSPTARSYAGKILKNVPGHAGYLKVNLWKPMTNKPRQARVHIILLEAFIGPQPPGAEGCHKDDDRLNNTFPNLYWGTRSANQLDAVANRRHRSITRPDTYRTGSASPRGKLNNAQVIRIRKQRLLGASVKDLASQFEVSLSTIERICKGRSYPCQNSV